MTCLSFQNYETIFIKLFKKTKQIPPPPALKYLILCEIKSHKFEKNKQILSISEKKNLTDFNLAESSEIQIKL